MPESCPLCARSDLLVVLERANVPVQQNLPLPTREAARSAPRGELRVACCRACGFVTNLAFSESLLRYAAGYDNDQTFSPSFEQHVESLVRRLTETRDLREANVVEVGCGNGQFLRKVCQRGGCRGVGYDPAYVGDDEADGGRVRFVREYYGARHAGTPADIVVCRHVIEHVPRPLLLLGAVRDALAGSARAATFFETPAVDWIFDNVVVQDFFYEHCSYFTAESLAYAFRCSGFAPASVARLFGDQYLWLEATHESGTHVEAPLPSAARVVASAQRFARLEAERSARLRERLTELRRQGPVAIWGAGAKGVTFLNHLDPDGALVDCIVDINPRKQGKFLPGTGHEILGPEQLAARGVANVMIMNPNYSTEIAALLQRQGSRVGIVSDAEGP